MNFNKGEIICIDKPYRMSSFGALAHIRFLISKRMGVKRVKTGTCRHTRSACHRSTHPMHWQGYQAHR